MSYRVSDAEALRLILDVPGIESVLGNKDELAILLATLVANAGYRLVPSEETPERPRE